MPAFNHSESRLPWLQVSSSCSTFSYSLHQPTYSVPFLQAWEMMQVAMGTFQTETEDGIPDLSIGRPGLPGG